MSAGNHSDRGEQGEIKLLVGIEQLDELERKVVSALQNLETLRLENGELKNQISSWQAQNQQQAAEIQRLSKECESLRRNQRDPQREEQIRSKIEGLIKKLDRY